MPLDFVSSVLVSTVLTGALSALARRTVLITNGQPVPPGTDGGVSPLGQLCAIGAALYTSIVGWFVLSNLARMWNLVPTMPSAPVYVLIPIAIGFLGCQLDSVLGATLERRGLVSKKTVNLVSTTTGAIVAYLILVAAGPLPTA